MNTKKDNVEENEAKIRAKAERASSRLITKSRATVKKYSLPSFDVEPDSLKIDAPEGVVPQLWEYVAPPNMSKKDRIKQLAVIKKRTKNQDIEKERLEKRNDEYRRKMEEDGKKLAEDLRLKKEHILAIVNEEANIAEIERLQNELAIKKIEEDANAKKAEIEKQRLDEEAQRESELKEMRSAERKKRLAERQAQAELKAKAEVERVEADKVASRERDRIRLEKEKLAEEMRREKEAFKQKELEEQLKNEALALELERARKLEEEKEKYENTAKDRESQLLEQEAKLAEIKEQEAKIRKEDELIRQERAKAKERRDREARLVEIMEAKRIKKEKREFKVRDFEYQPYPKDYGKFDENSVVEFHEVSVKSGNYSFIDGCDFKVNKVGLTVVHGYSENQVKTLISVIMRTLPYGLKVTSGEVRIAGRSAITVKEKEHGKQIADMTYVFRDTYTKSPMRVKTYVKDAIGTDNSSVAKDIFARLNLNYKSVASKKLKNCAHCEIAKVYLVCALLSNAPLVILAEPQKYLDAPSRLALKELIEEWSEKNVNRAMLLFTSDDGLIAGYYGGKNG